MTHLLHEIQPYWSWILAPFGLLGMVLTGRKNRKGWALSIFTQILWLGYAVQTQQWGFMPGSAAYGGVYVKNFLLWKKIEERKLVEEKRKKEIYQSLRYWLETSLAPSDAEEAVALLDELAKDSEDKNPDKTNRDK